MGEVISFPNNDLFAYVKDESGDFGIQSACGNLFIGIGKTNGHVIIKSNSIDLDRITVCSALWAASHLFDPYQEALESEYICRNDGLS